MADVEGVICGRIHVLLGTGPDFARMQSICVAANVPSLAMIIGPGELGVHGLITRVPSRDAAHEAMGHLRDLGRARPGQVIHLDADDVADFVVRARSVQSEAVVLKHRGKTLVDATRGVVAGLAGRIVLDAVVQVCVGSEVSVGDINAAMEMLDPSGFTAFGLRRSTADRRPSSLTVFGMVR